MRFTTSRNPIPETFKGKPAEYPVFNAFRSASPAGKLIYAAATFGTLGTFPLIAEAVTYFNARHTAKQSLKYKRELETAVPQGQWPKQGAVMEYLPYAEQIAQTTAALRANSSYMNVANAAQLAPGQEPGQFAQNVRSAQMAGAGAVRH